MELKWHERLYALYKGEQFVTEGTLPEISVSAKKSIDWLRYMTYPAYDKRCNDSSKRLRLVPLDDDEE
ncbi:hypothetical protein [Bacillus cereus group sp. BfR-BA-01318]|uniref:hypothetical protein n=1 Tax=unclassified Bacillus cereus group TaxID=2750818 RepID=UPI001298E373|nr:hypothetical protein [Bacillus cereus group sp. BfR-BA-01318]MEB9419891.1 hypothetical protein [Bacillus cereus]MRD20732.1 hypothetical protein [Bacillus thuringiensis]